MKTSKNPLETLTEGERHWFGQWLTPSQVLQGIEEASKFRGVADIGGGAAKGRKGSAPLWRPLGETFRKREASLYQRVESAATLINSENPEVSKYENSQRLLDYLSGKADPDGSELKAEITELRKEIPTIPASTFQGLEGLDAGSEADAYHDEESGVVYKLYKVNGGKMDGELRLRWDNEISVSTGGRPTFPELIERIERSNSHGAEWNTGFFLRMENWGGPSATDKRRYIEALKQGVALTTIESGGC